MTKDECLKSGKGYFSLSAISLAVMIIGVSIYYYLNYLPAALAALIVIPGCMALIFSAGGVYLYIRGLSYNKILTDVIENKKCNFVVQRPNKEWKIKLKDEAKKDNPQLEMGLSFNNGALYAGIISYYDNKQEYTLEQLFELLGPLKETSEIKVEPRIMKVSKYGYPYMEEVTYGKNSDTDRQIKITVKGFECDERKNFIYITGLLSEFDRKNDDITFIIENFRPYNIPQNI